MPKIFQLLPRIFTRQLGDPVTYTPAGGAPVTIYAIIDTTPQIDGGYEGAGGAVSHQVASVRSADVAGVAEGATLQRQSDGASWRVVEPIQPDGEGMTALTLERQA